MASIITTLDNSKCFELFITLKTVGHYTANECNEKEHAH